MSTTQIVLFAGSAQQSVPVEPVWPKVRSEHPGLPDDRPTANPSPRGESPAGFTPRGLGFGVGKESGSPGCSDQTFGHTGSTGTLCWADPASDTICVVLTSLPRRGAQRHPREIAAEQVAAAARR